MRDPEYYARPGLYLDEDDHERLIDENREAFRRERRERLVREQERIARELERLDAEEGARYDR